MKKRMIVVIMAVALMCTVLSGCKTMSDEMMTAVTSFTDEVSRITEQTDEATELLGKASDLLTNGKPVADVTATSALQTAMETVKEQVTFEVSKRPSSLNAINEAVEQLKSIDYTPQLTALKNAITAVVNSQEDYAMNDTLVTLENGVWGVYENGELTDYSGIAENEHGTWYVKDGAVDFTYTGSYDFAGKTFEVNGGKVNK